MGREAASGMSTVQHEGSDHVPVLEIRSASLAAFNPLTLTVLSSFKRSARSRNSRASARVFASTLVIFRSPNRYRS